MRYTVSLFLKHRDEVFLAIRASGQRFAGLLQATVHGRVEEGETQEMALERELEEESSLVLPMVRDLRFLEDVEAGTRHPERCSYYVGIIDEQFHKKMIPGVEHERFIAVNKKDLERIQVFDATRPHVTPGTLVMFADEKRMLEKVMEQ